LPEFEPTGLARLPLMLLRHVEVLGLDRARLMAAAGLDAVELNDPDARVPIQKSWSLWRAILERRPDGAMGLRLGAAARVRDLGVVGYTMFYSSTLGAALARLCRYSHVITKAVQYRLEHDAGLSSVALEGNPRFDSLIQPLDARLAFVVAAAREITGADVVPHEVCFSYEEPLDVAEHQRFFRCPLRFERTPSAVVFSRQDLDRPAVAGDETLGGYLDRVAEEVLQSLEDRSSLREQVQRTIWSQLAAGPPSLPNVASRLGQSPRTLQRRLRASGTSFAELLDELRRHMALRLLKDRSLAIYEVAFLLGYSDPSTFYRAFRRWHGAPPDEFRRKAG
jgi:AraC-like DNA-binding protein